jgi:hypothetical protein
MFGNQFDKAMKAAEGALTKWCKISRAIDTQRGKLLAVIPRLLEADAAVRGGEADEALGESTGVAGKARKSRDTVCAEIDRYGECLHGLRGKRVTLTTDLVEARDGVARELPGYLEARKTELLAEWEEAVKALEPLLIRRRVLEKLLGQSLALPELRPTSDTGDSETAVPQARLGDIDKALTEIQTEARVARFADNPGAPGPYDVLIVRHPVLDMPIHGMAPGTHVLSAVFARGQLAHLAASKWAHPIPDSQLRQAGIVARAALARADAERIEQERRQAQAKRDEADAEYLRLHPEEAARRRSEAMRQAAVVEERRRQGYGEGPTPRPVAAGLSQIVVPEFTQHPDTGA